MEVARPSSGKGEVARAVFQSTRAFSAATSICGGMIRGGEDYSPQPIHTHRSHICCPRDVSLSDSKCWNGGQKWVNSADCSSIHNFTHRNICELILNQTEIRFYHFPIDLETNRHVHLVFKRFLGVYTF